MRVAIDLSPTCGAWTGVGRYIHDLVAHLTDVALVGVYQGHHGPPSADCLSHCDSAARYDLIGGRPGLRWRLPRLLRRQQVDCYHATSSIGVPGPAWRGPVIATINDTFPLEPQCRLGRRQRRLFRSLLTAICARADRLICPSTYAADSVRRHGWQGTTTVIPYGVSAFDPPARPASAPAEPYLLTVGALEPRKGLHELAGSLIAGGHRLPWIHCGPVRHDPDGAIAAAMQRAGADLRGWVSESERRAWLAHAALLAQPSALEGFGYTALEAMAQGVPVVARAGGSQAEVLGDAARRLPEDDPRAWGAIVAGLLADASARQELAARGRAQAAGFSCQAMADAHRSVYAEVCACG